MSYLMSHPAEYRQLVPGTPLPTVCTSSPYRAVLVIDTKVTPEWQATVSDWLVLSGCLYMMAWGENCRSWDDSVDEANIRQFFPAQLPDDKLVMTTWHEQESLREVFWFAKNGAVHPTVHLDRTMLVHIGSHNKANKLQKIYASA